MAELMHLRKRETGARAVAGRTGPPQIRSATGGKIDIATGAMQSGFNPDDLFYASLASCLVISSRTAASRFGVLGQVTEVTVDVQGIRSAEEPTRIEHLHVRIDIQGDIETDLRRTIVGHAKTICTVSNTLLATPIVEIELVA